MKFRLLLIIFSVVFTTACKSQGFFGPLPKPSAAALGKGKFSLSSDSVMNAFRPVANIASYGFTHGSGVLLTGAGISWQHLKFDLSSNKWSCVYSISALGWYTAPLSTSEGPTSAFAYGISVGVINNLIMIGGGINTTTNQFIGTIGIGISLNN
jgi:hypothetical protein